MTRNRIPSAPGVPGARLPGPDSVPPEERILRELSAVEGRMLSRLSDVDERLERLESRQSGSDEDVRGIREDVAQLRTDLGTLTRALLHAQTVANEHERGLGELRTDMVRAGGIAGGKRGAIAGVATAIAVAVGKWLAHKAGLDL